MSSAAAGRWRRVRRTVAAVATGGLVGLPVAVLHPPTVSGAVPTVSASVPLAAAESGPGGTWAVLAMGHLGTRENTFWQLFHQGTAGSRWTLLTPPGVASNGGLVADGTSSAELVGFEPSQWLKYSPVARTTDTGRSWIAGSLPSGLEDVPDALATEPDGTVGGLTRRDGGTVVAASGSITAWRSVATLSSLAGSPAAQACRPTALTAIAAAATRLLVGTACGRSGVVGVYALAGGTWTSEGFAPGGPAATATVIRLETSATGTAALVELRRNGSTSLVAAWQAATGGSWSSSQELRADGRVEATASAATGAVVVTSGGDGHRVTAETTGPSPTTGSGAPGATPPGWRRLPAVPAHTAMVVDAQGTLVALSVASSKFWSYADVDGSWVLRTSVKVPIQYGSST